MLKNYFVLAFRNFKKNRSFSLISLAGLSLGIAVFLLIFEYTAFEWSTNRFNKNYNELYRVDMIHKDGTPDYFNAPGLAPILKDKFTGVESYTRIAEGIGSGVINIEKGGTGTTSFREEKISYVDADFLKLFSFPLLEGNASLLEPKTTAISESMARKFFGNTQVVGKIMSINNQFGITPYTVTAVYKDIPAQSDIRADLLLSLSTLNNTANRNGNDWADPQGLESGFASIYVLLKKGIRADLLQQQITDYIHTLKPEAQEHLVLQRFADIHLAPSFDYTLPTFGNLTLAVFLLGVGLLILFIAWINYINLSTAQALKRAKEVGIRKVLGASRGQLIVQYLSETFLLTFSAVLAACLLVTLLQPLFNSFIEKKLSLAVLNQGPFWIAGILLIAVGSLLSGCYVAFMLSSFKPVKTIKGKIENAGKGISLHKGLVVFQFSISVLFIIATIVLYKQLRFMKAESLGMNIQQRMVLKGPTSYNDEDAKNVQAFKNALAQLPFIEKYTASNNIPGQGYNFSADGISRLNPQPEDKKKGYSMLITDEKYFDTYNISFAQGSSFTPADVQQGWSRARRVIINEKAAAQLGFSKGESLVGKKILWGDEYEIAGVIKDYHHLSLRKPIEPVIYLPSTAQGYFTLLTTANNMAAKLSTLKTIYQTYFPNYPFEYFFADELYDQQYSAEQKLGTLFITAALVAIFIACMGLFGLAAFSTRQRTKEIGIRKVLGAGIKDITLLLSKDFILLVIIAIVIASPIAWWATSKWLEDFAYRTQINGWIFFLAAGIAIGIALLTVSFHSIKAAVANPVKSLRTEG